MYFFLSAGDARFLHTDECSGSEFVFPMPKFDVELESGFDLATFFIKIDCKNCIGRLGTFLESKTVEM